MAAAQAFDFRAPAKPAPATQAAYQAVRRHVKKLEEDRPLHEDINTLAKAAKDGEILEAARRVVAELK